MSTTKVRRWESSLATCRLLIVLFAKMDPESVPILFQRCLAHKLQ